MGKICTKCSIYKELEYYQISSGYKRNICKACTLIRDRESKKKWEESNKVAARESSKLRRRKYRAELKEQKLKDLPTDYGSIKICTKCKEEKVLNLFNNQKNGKFGKKGCCKSCESIAWSSRTVETKDKRKDQTKIYRENNRLELRKRSIRHHHKRRDLKKGIYTQEQWDWFISLCGNICLRCKESKKITVDHVQPIVKGGSNTLDNLQPLCLKCNQTKNSKYIDFRSDMIRDQIRQYLGSEATMFHG